MSSTKTAPKTASAASVRKYFQDRPALMADLSEAAQVTVRPGARGQLHPEAIEVANKRRRPQYTRGADSVTKAAARKAAVEAREALRAQGVEVGERGPLPKPKA